MVDAAIALIHQRVFSMLLDPEQREGSCGASVSACAPHLEEAGGACQESTRADDADGALHGNGTSALLEIRDLARLTRILVDLNRITIARQRQAEDARMRLEEQKLADRQRREETEGGLSDEAYNAIRNALLGIKPHAPNSEHREGSGSTDVPAAPGLEGPPEEFGKAGVPASEDNFEGSDWEDPERSAPRQDADNRASTPKTNSEGPPGDTATSGKTRLRSNDQGQMKLPHGRLFSTSQQRRDQLPAASWRPISGTPRIAAVFQG
jgi:hypothetical protein